MSVQRAAIEKKSAALHTDFAKEFVARRFGAADAALIYSLLPTYSRGPRKGLCKGYVHWDKVNIGGWVHEQGGLGHVERPGTRNIRIMADNDCFRTSGIPDKRKYENETDAERAEFIKCCITDMFAKPSVFASRY